MHIRIGFELSFQVAARTPMILTLYTHPSRSSSLLTQERVCVEPRTDIEEFTDPFGNHCGRLVASPGKLRLWSKTSVEDSGLPDPVAQIAQQQPVEDLPAGVLPFLFGSRYCEVDKLSDVAWSLFGQTRPGWSRVQSICNWVHTNVRFGYQFARMTKSAWEVYQERNGVCRDLNHLALTFCRCLGIPARYATGYLGDIGVPPSPCPMDFSGWFEAYLDGRWHTFDARHNVPRIGRVLMARGRDAVDVAMTTSFGQTKLEKFVVVTDEIHEPQFAGIV